MRKAIGLIAMTAVIGIAAGCKTAGNATGKKSDSVSNVLENFEKKEKKEATMPQGRLMEVEYQYQDMNMYMVSHPRLKRTDDGSTLTVEVRGKGDVVLQVSDTLLDAARTIIEKDSMYAYDSYYGLPPELERGMLDGFRWEFKAVFEGKERIWSSGKHVTPDNDGLQHLNELLINAAMEQLKSLTPQPLSEKRGE